MGKRVNPWGFDPEAPPDPAAGFFGMDVSIEEAGVIVLPVPFEATASYGRGSSKGPEAMRRASHQLDFFDGDFGRPYAAGIATAPAACVARYERLNEEATGAVERLRCGAVAEAERAGLVARVNELCREAHEGVRAQVDEWAGAGKLVAVVGGDHSVAFGSLAAIAERIEEEIGVLQIDAHADLRHEYEGFQWSHASIMDNVLTRLPTVSKLVQVAIRDFSEREFERIEASRGRIVAFPDSEIKGRVHRGDSFLALCDRILAELPSRVYVSCDIDGLDPSLCPSTGTPVPGGLSFDELGFLLALLARSGRRIVGLDLCEVAPGAGDWDANVGARVLYKLIGAALFSSVQA